MHWTQRISVLSFPQISLVTPTLVSPFFVLLYSHFVSCCVFSCQPRSGKQANFSDALTSNTEVDLLSWRQESPRRSSLVCKESPYSAGKRVGPACWGQWNDSLAQTYKLASPISVFWHQRKYGPCWHNSVSTISVGDERFHIHGVIRS